jgi:mannose-6-phosphate isomerase-like protein (cupin superfamily)
MNTDVANLDRAVAAIDQHWDPRIFARVNDHMIKVVKVEGEFVWHSHSDSDEMFLVLDGELTVGLRDTDRQVTTITLGVGDSYVIPRGVVHRPESQSGATNTGEHEGDLPDHIVTTLGRENRA